MRKNQAIEILYKYKDNLPFDYEKFYNDLLEGNIDALKYMAYLTRHNNDIELRKSLMPLIVTRRPGQLVDDYLMYDRMNFTVCSESLIRFDGYF